MDRLPVPPKAATMVNIDVIIAPDQVHQHRRHSHLAQSYQIIKEALALKRLKIDATDKKRHAQMYWMQLGATAVARRQLVLKSIKGS